MFWGTRPRRAEPDEESQLQNIDATYTLAEPGPENRFSFRPEDVGEYYTGWPKLVELCAVRLSMDRSSDAEIP